MLGDPQQLTQVLVNLLSNACDASSPGGQVEVKMSNGGGTVDLAVIDHGVGMDEQVRRHIFEPFFTTKDPGAGTGLGLSIVHRIIQNHGGTIDVDSAVGQGSRFNVSLLAAGMVP